MSIGVSSLGCADLIFIDPCIKVRITGTRWCDNNFWRRFVWCLATFSHSSKTTLQPTVPARRLHCCQLRHLTSLVHSTGCQTAQISIQLITRSGAFCKSESTVAKSVTSTIWKND